MNTEAKELNKELEGIIMGENEIARLKERATDYKVIELLDKVLITVQKNKDLIVKEIEELNEKVTYDEGIWGKLLEVFNSIKEMNVDTDKEILQTAIKGTEMGFKAILDFLIKDNNIHEHLKKNLIEVSDEYAKLIKSMQEYLLKLT
ncbi:MULTISPECIES: hypothetical protein [unclassified Clostridium]|uniref:hypothetical protein n=1 Tax=unclassified Clostridium TaxID=2614128 RepID=UPI00189A09A8|nr:MULTISPECIES: hypothetical protein [unclassified Clostridium]MCR1951696.1 hypothetical protein [Clostridium sp. DSM 100503]